ncbi:type I-D CRISPR-associated protein Cas7/Csc2 [Oculatella sp. FACHB-28]|uniref:type I-D CRISPR-associated protein Cas7/Csc2 n=1 Tax=Oculatella sp. FACHB-28 TaxID=2692845 RepID=UPI0016884A39|nr:type I-D CRISPR-associated protein Cas7/Csc2 [Oculatella sp. FACHB-28]MBD2060482.1 type I-D CRISPR-associated protein Cas7/Csc2 [Oculatella sp. FACHB-28]
MSLLEKLRPQFHAAFPRLASGNYVHFFLVRHSQSFPVFQTDGVLNTARTQAGLESEGEKSRQLITRLVMFKRKQVTPERLVGRQLLRSLGLTSAVEGENNFCEYNSQKSCKKCPDCIIYGFGIGDKGAERSKVYSDSAFSLSPYETSHRSFTFNAPSENGTMSEKGEMRNSINDLDHVLPEVTFPSVETLRDPTFEGFIYVLGNLLRTRRYGGQESRTGTMTNHIIGIAFCDGEVFSNLYFTQAIYDALSAKGDTQVPIGEVRQQAAMVAENCLRKEPVRSTIISGNELDSLLEEVIGMYQDEARLRTTMSTLCQKAQTYSETYGALVLEKKKAEKKKAEQGSSI